MPTPPRANEVWDDHVDALVYTATSNDVTTGGSTVITWPAMQEAIFNMNNVWDSWTSGTSVTCNSCTTDTWRIWTDRTTSGSTTAVTIPNGLTAAADYVWGMPSWQNCRHTQVRWTPSVYRTLQEPPVHVRTPEEIAAAAAKRELERQKRLRRSARKHRFKEAAEQRAREMLMEMLTPEQRVELEEKNHFHLTVYDRDGSHRVYRIEQGYAGNVKLLGADGNPVKRYCIHADSRLPKEDQMLAQKLLLEANERNSCGSPTPAM